MRSHSIGLYQLVGEITFAGINQGGIDIAQMEVCNMMARESHELFEDHEHSGTASILEAHECRLKDIEKMKQDADVDFDPSAPYSSSMDNVPLKVLFGVPNVKMRQSPTQEKKTSQIDLSSPKGYVDSSDSVRTKLRESLASALAMVWDEQPKSDVKIENNLAMVWDEQPKRDVKIENNFQIESTVLNKDGSMDYKFVKMVDPELSAMTDKYCQEESSGTLKRGREDFEENQVLAEATVSSGFLRQGSHQEQNELQINSESNVPYNGEAETRTFKRAKLEKEEIQSEVNEQTMQSFELAQIVSVKVEAELFRIYGSVNKKYKEKARSLLFNLKDRNNPELRARVVSGEISPERLCSMTAEQLASKELSQWRIAKAEELAYMIVLPDSDVDFRRLVKKTHKGEFQVEVEKDDVAPEVAAGGGQQLQTKQEDTENNEAPAVDEVAGVVDSLDHNEIGSGSDSPGSFPSCTLSGQVVGVDASGVSPAEIVTEEVTRQRKELPEIMSLDEYIGSREDQSNEDAEVVNPIQNEESTEWANTLQGNLEEGKASLLDDLSVSRKRMLIGEGKSESLSRKNKYSDGLNEWQEGNAARSSSYEILWEGTVQLNPFVVETVVAVFKSGEKTSAKDWSKYVEVKGRVRLDAFEKFLQELPLSRSRRVMVVSICCKGGSSENGPASIQEVADSYKQGERVGYAEPAPGVELYLCPTDVITMKVLNKYVSHEDFENINEQNGLIGCVVWRRNNVTSNIMHKMPEQQYINAKKLALSGQMLDSPTRPGVLDSVPYGTDSPNYVINSSLENHSVQSRSPTMKSALTTTLLENITSEDKDASETDIPPGFGSETDIPPGFGSWPPCDQQKDVPKIIESSELNDDLIDDVPPGFGPTAAVSINGGYTQNLDDDDLPEFDYGVSVPYQRQIPQSDQLPPEVCSLQPLSSTQSPSQSSQPQVSISNQGYFQSNVNLHSPQVLSVGHQVVQQVPRPPATPHPSMKIRELIQKFGQSDAVMPFTSGPNSTPDVSGVHIATQIGQQAGPTASQVPVNAHNQMPENNSWNEEDDIPEWRPPYFSQGNSSLVVPPMEPMLPSQLGVPNLIGSLQPVHPLPPRVTPPQRCPQQMPPPQRCPQQMPPPQRGPPHMLPPQALMQQCLPPPLPQGPRPLTGMVRPVPMMTQRVPAFVYANNSPSFHTSHNFRLALSGPDIRPLDARNRRI